MSSDSQPRPSRLLAGVGDRVSRPYPHLDLLSATMQTPYWLREDPFYERWVWDPPPRVVPKTNPDTGRDDFDDPPSRRRDAPWFQPFDTAPNRRALAWLNGFGYATTPQLRAAAGLARGRTTEHFTTAYDMGIFRRGRLEPAVRLPGSKPYVWALHRGAPLRALVRELDHDVAASILGNVQRQITTNHRHLHHAALVVELTLRVLEVQPEIVGISGAHGASPARLFPGQQHRLKIAGDVVLHRGDGLRIVIKVAASSNDRHLRRTVTRWARLLSRFDPNDSALVFVLVNAHADRHTAMARRLREIVHQYTMEGAFHISTPTGQLATALDRARTQIHLASWRDWFPASRTISEAGRGLFTVATLGGNRWAAQSLVDPDSHPHDPKTSRHQWPMPWSPTSLLIPAWTEKPPVYDHEDARR